MSSFVRQFDKKPVWQPDEKSGGRMKAFIRTVEKKHNLNFGDYWEFYRWTVENIAEFWADIWDFFGIIHSKPYDQVIDLSIPMEKSAKWFEGARLNFAENLLKRRDDHIALILAGEDREVEKVSYKQVYEEASVYASALRKSGLQKGDVVAYDFLETDTNPDGTIPEMVFEQVSFSHPVFISFTPGTTGLPKTLVHGFGGLLSMAKNFALHKDVLSEDIYLSTTPVSYI